MDGGRGKLQVQGDVLVLYVYQLKTSPGPDGAENVAVEKVSFRKTTAAAAPAAPGPPAAAT